MKKKVWLFRPVSYILLALCLALTIVTFFLNHIAFFIELGVFLLAVGYVLWEAHTMNREIKRLLEQVSDSITPSRRDSLEQFPLPVLSANEQGEILWYNDLMRKNMLDGSDCYTRSVGELFGTGAWREACHPNGLHVHVAGKRVTAYGAHTADGLYMFYCVDNTEMQNKADEYDATRPSVLLLAIDNYDELMQNYRESEKAHLLVEIDRILEAFIGSTTGFMLKIERDKYLAVVEERHMAALIETKFPVLDQVRSIVEAGKVPATLSIGIGRTAPTLADGELQARQALDMCLGRGGDQVAVKTAGGYEFYGGVGRGIEKKTKVKTRIVANALHDLILTSDNVIIMGHNFGDLDSVGASVGLARSCRELGKHAVIATYLARNLAAPLIDRLVSHGYGDYFEEPEDLLNTITKKTLLIVVDTHIQSFLESQDIYKRCKNVAVIDHHRKMVGHIDNAVIFYHEPYASSASEMVTELVQYFTDQTLIGRYEAEALLAGIMLDTKNFVLKTGVRTFEAAAYLRRLGADTVEVRKLFASTMEAYQKRARLMAQAEIYKRCAIAVSNAIGEDMRIVAPQAADEMLGISDVDASFVVYRTNEGISYSARSMGAMNVQIIMEKLGGGGHQTMAGAQATGITLEEAKRKLLEVIDAYYQSRTPAL